MTTLPLISIFSYKSWGSEPVLLAADSGETPGRVWVAVSGTLLALGLDGTPQVRKVFLFNIRFLATASESVIVAGEEKGLEVLSLSGETRVAHQYAVTALCADDETFAFCAKDHPSEVYLHGVSSQMIDKVLTLDEAVSGIALRDTRLATALPASNQVAVWDISEAEPRRLYNIPVGPSVEKLSFGLQPEEFFVWRGDDQVLVRYSRENWKATIPAHHCFLNRHAIFYGKQGEECTLEWINGSCPTQGLPGPVISGIATPGWIAVAADRGIELFDIIERSPFTDCTVS